MCYVSPTLHAFVLSSLDAEVQMFHDSVQELKTLVVKSKRDYEIVPHPAGNRKARRAYEAQERKKARR